MQHVWLIRKKYHMQVFPFYMNSRRGILGKAHVGDEVLAETWKEIDVLASLLFAYGGFRAANVVSCR